MTSKLSFFVGSKKKGAKKYSQFEGNKEPASRCIHVLGDLCTCGRGRSRRQKGDNKMPRYHVVAIGEQGLIGKNELLLQYIYGSNVPHQQDCDEFDPHVDKSYTLQREINKENVLITIETWEAGPRDETDTACTDATPGTPGTPCGTEDVTLDLPSDSEDAAGASAASAAGGASPEGRAINWESVDRRFVEEEKFPDGFLLIYSVTNPESFNMIPEMHGQILSIAQKHRQLHSLLVPSEESSSHSFCSPPMLLVANNVGPIFIRKVSSAQGRAMASQLDIGYIEACPKGPPINISETFSKLCEMVKKARQQAQTSCDKKKKKSFGFSRSLPPSSPPPLLSPPLRSPPLLPPLGGAAFASNV